MLTEGQPPGFGPSSADYGLHRLGWKAFQDLCIAVAEECLRRPVQSFLPNNDAGRDGAFIGRWEGADPAAGESTIQCKFTSQLDKHLSLSMLANEMEKARALAAKGLATDYIILTNHPVTGASEIQIKAAFEAVGVGRCRVFAREWITAQIRASPKLRMMAPRLYGLGDLSELLDSRAYAQAQIILSAMGNELERLVVTEAHRRSVRAISAHNLVLLLGAPAAGKSTIGASLAIGAADIWQSSTIRATCPEDIQKHLSPGHSQFFWIDDAWGSTQYQRQTAEAWNQVFPLMRGAIRNGTKFLLTSRDYIWKAAQADLKLQALPVLNQSKVIINVHELSTQEKAQILYNHIKLGDQPAAFRQNVKEHLPEIAERKDFLPEAARRLGSRFFAGRLPTSHVSVMMFFENPEGFLLDTIANLAADCRAAIAVVFMNGGRVRSPTGVNDLQSAAVAFDVNVGEVRSQLEALNGSLLLLAHDDTGPYWTYKHPTVGDAFARYVARSPELVEIYLRGAQPDSIAYEVVCAGCNVFGATVVVPDTLHSLLAERLNKLQGYALATFLSYRSNRRFSDLMLQNRPDILRRLCGFSIPLSDDRDAKLAATLHSQGLLPEDIRLNFVEEVRTAAVDRADGSFLDDDYSELAAVLTEDERASILDDAQHEVLAKIPQHVERLRDEWSSDTSPDTYFEQFEKSVSLFATALPFPSDRDGVMRRARGEISYAIAHMNDHYEPSTPTSV